MLLRSRPANPEALRAGLLALREGVRKKVLGLEAKHRKRRFPLEKARQEFQRNLQQLLALKEQGRFPAALLDQAILREELRIAHVDQELSRMDKAFRDQVAALWAKARHEAAKRVARSGMEVDLDAIFPEVRDELPG